MSSAGRAYEPGSPCRPRQPFFTDESARARGAGLSGSSRRLHWLASLPPAAGSASASALPARNERQSPTKHEGESERSTNNDGAVGGVRNGHADLQCSGEEERRFSSARARNLEPEPCARARKLSALAVGALASPASVASLRGGAARFERSGNVAGRRRSACDQLS